MINTSKTHTYNRKKNVDMDNKLNFVKFTKTICELIKVFSQLILFSTSKQQTPK